MRFIVSLMYFNKLNSIYVDDFRQIVYKLEIVCLIQLIEILNKILIEHLNNSESSLV